VELMQPEIISIGEPLLEFSASTPGDLHQVEQFVVGWGGDSSNFAIAASRSGSKVGYITRLGQDEFGRSFLNLWTAEGIDTRFVEQDPDRFTGFYFISRKDQKHTFTYYRKESAASRIRPESLPFETIRNARLVHVTGIAQGISSSGARTIDAAIETAKAAGATVSYDPNLRLKLWSLEKAKATILPTIARSDIVFPSFEDAEALTGLTDEAQIARFFLDLGPRIVLLKLGSKGVLLATRESKPTGAEIQLAHFKAHKVESLDFSGAGDTFAGAFAANYLTGASLEECTRYANAAAALTTTGLGCVKPIPCRDAIEQLMRNQDGQ